MKPIWHSDSSISPVALRVNMSDKQIAKTPCHDSFIHNILSVDVNVYNMQQSRRNTNKSMPDIIFYAL
jgi:hypothetical protein